MEKNYTIVDKWLDLGKENVVNIKSVDGVIEGGGGGSSDFSTATVTIISQNVGLVGKMVYGLMTPYYAYEAGASAHGGSPTVIPIILYQGQIMLVKENATLTISSVSGNIDYDPDEDIYIITGDCTITVG